MRGTFEVQEEKKSNISLSKKQKKKERNKGNSVEKGQVDGPRK